MLLTNIPVPVPSVVWESAVVGVWLVLQQTPRAVTVAPPSEVIFPPLVAVVAAILVAAVVVRIGGVVAERVTKVSSVPYDVPTLLVA